LINYQEEQTYENFLLTSPIEEANLIKIAKILTDCTGYLQVILYKGYVRYIKIAPETYDVSIFKEIVLFKKNKALVVNNFVFDSIPDFSDTEIQYFDLSFTRIKQTFDFAKFPKELELLELFNTGITSFQNCDKVKKIANLVIALNNTADIGCSSDKINFCVGCYPFEMTWQIFDGDKKLRKKKEKEFYEFVRKSPKRLNYPMLP
jgi:hypothetical protein